MHDRFIFIFVCFLSVCQIHYLFVSLVPIIVCLFVYMFIVYLLFIVILSVVVWCLGCQNMYIWHMASCSEVN